MSNPCLLRQAFMHLRKTKCVLNIFIEKKAKLWGNGSVNEVLATLAWIFSTHMKSWVQQFTLKLQC